MKSKSIISIILATVLFCTSCEDTSTTSDFKQNSTSVDTVRVSGIQKVATATPSVSSVSGSLGSSIPNTHPLYNSYLLASYSTGSKVTISGANFGTSKGNVVLEKASGSSWVSTSSYSISIVSWSNTKVVVNIYSTLSSEPIASARFKVSLPNSSATFSKSISVVNSTLGRLFGECTYHAISRTLQKGLSGWSSAYSSSGVKSITTSYVPTANDVLIWGLNHQAFIESVSTSKSGNITTYVLTISERNVKGSSLGGGYSTDIVTRSTTVKVNTSTKTFVSGYSTYRSILTAGADKVRIQ